MFKWCISHPGIHFLCRKFENKARIQVHICLCCPVYFALLILREREGEVSKNSCLFWRPVKQSLTSEAGHLCELCWACSSWSTVLENKLCCPCLGSAQIHSSLALIRDIILEKAAVAVLGQAGVYLRQWRMKRKIEEESNWQNWGWGSVGL